MATASRTTQTAIVHAVVPQSMRLELERRARENERTLSSEIRRCLRLYFEGVAAGHLR
jgi:hypothetical protein